MYQKYSIFNFYISKIKIKSNIIEKINDWYKNHIR